MWTLLLLVALPRLAHPAPVVAPPLPLDCEDIYAQKVGKVPGSVPSGVYTVYAAGPQKPLRVFCDMGCSQSNHQDARWTVIQRRLDGNVSFYRPWRHYKDGFGDPKGEYWLGLENVFLLTFRHRYQLRVDMEDFERGRAYAQYTAFYVDAETANYRLHVSGFVDGGAGDSMTYSDGRDFSTFDRDTGSCADSYGGGFWYGTWQCHLANPNGLYKRGAGVSSYTGITWYTWKGSVYSLKTIAMKIRRVSVEDLKEL